MGSNLHYTVDLNEDQNCRPFFSSLGSSPHQQHFHQPASSNPSYSMSPSLSYFPLLINSHHQDQVSVGLNNNIFHGVLDTHLSQPLEIKKFVSDSGSSSSDQTVPKKTRLKLKIKKKDNHQDRSNLPQYPTKGKVGTNTLKWVSTKVKLMKKKKSTISTTNNNKQHIHNDQSSNQNNLEGDHLKKNSRNQYNIIVDQNGYNGSNDCVVRFCSDCNTTKTPLWRSGPKGPKSLCNACGIRQRKARRAAAMATATTISDMSPPLLKKKIQNKKKKSNGVSNISSPSDERMITVEEAETAQVQSESTMLSSSFSSDKFYLDDLAIILSKSSAYQQVFPQDEKEAAILLMALSYGMVRG